MPASREEWGSERSEDRGSAHDDAAERRRREPAGMEVAVMPASREEWGSERSEDRGSAHDDAAERRRREPAGMGHP